MNIWKNTVFSAAMISALGVGVAAHAADATADATAATTSTAAATDAASSEVVVTVQRNHIPTLTDVAGNTVGLWKPKAAA